MKKYLGLLFLVIILSGCQSYSNLDTVSSENVNQEAIGTSLDDTIAFPSGDMTFLEYGIDSQNENQSFYCLIEWKNLSNSDTTFSAVFPQITAKQFATNDYKNSAGLDLTPTDISGSENKIAPNKKQKLKLMYELENQKDIVYLTITSRDGFDKHHDFYLE